MTDIPVEVRFQSLAVVSPQSDWLTVLAAGKVNTADNSGNPITRPDQFTDRGVLVVGGRGTHLLIRMRYKGEPTQAPRIEAFGIDINGKYWRLQAADGNNYADLTADTTNDVIDPDDTDYRHTDVDVDGGSTAFDMQGAVKVVLGVRVALTTTVGGDAALATIEAKVV